MLRARRGEDDDEGKRDNAKDYVPYGENSEHVDGHLLGLRSGGGEDEEDAAKKTKYAENSQETEDTEAEVWQGHVQAIHIDGFNDMGGFREQVDAESEEENRTDDLETLGHKGLTDGEAITHWRHCNENTTNRQMLVVLIGLCA